MEYKAVILTAGMGKRVGNWSEVFNKALLPINGKPVMCQIIEKFPEDVEIVIAVGYLKEQVMMYLKTNYPTRKFNFVDVIKYTGEGSGPGYSLLQCSAHLQCPFVFYAVDTVVTDSVPIPDRNWYGVAEVDDTTRFMSCRTDENMKVTRIDDKVKTDNKYAFIGLAGIYDYKSFWEGFKGNSTLIGGELQTSNGFIALKNVGMYAQVFNWFDTGTDDEYKRTQDYFRKHPEEY
jgi:NDP-sugar pyrophosphorylase family protein